MSTQTRNIALVFLGALTALAASACGPDDDPGVTCTPAPGTICTVAGTGSAGLSGDGQEATRAELYLPMDMALGPDGRLFVVDWNNHRIRAVDTDGTISTVAGTGLLGDGPEGPALGSAFNHPTSITFDPLGQIVIAAWHNSRLKRFDPVTGTVDDFCGTGARAYKGDDGPAEMAVLDLPSAVAFGPTGDLFVVDQANQVIRTIGADGIIRRFAGQCLVGPACEPGAVPTRCEGTDKWTCSADPMACMTPCVAAYGGDGGPALEARFAMPVGQAADPSGRIAIDATGNVFIADTNNHRIRRIGTDGMVTTVAGNGTRGFAGEGSAATEAQLDKPIDLAFGPDGALYFTDTGNHCVRAIGTDGNISTVIGVCGMRGDAGDGGPPTEALLDRPYGLDIDADGNIYVADTHNHRIRLFMR